LVPPDAGYRPKQHRRFRGNLPAYRARQLVCIDIGVDELGFRHEALKRAVRMIKIERLEFYAMFSEIIVKQGGDEAFADAAFVLGKYDQFFVCCGLG